LEQTVVALPTLERHVVPDPETVESSGLGRRRERGDRLDTAGEQCPRDAHPDLDRSTGTVHQ
jgi:hypothetical protein